MSQRKIWLLKVYPQKAVRARVDGTASVEQRSFRKSRCESEKWDEAQIKGKKSSHKVQDLLSRW